MGAVLLVKLPVINSHAQPGKNAKHKVNALKNKTTEKPFSGEPKHPPALVVQLRGQQHSGAALWVEPASKCERYFPSNGKRISFSRSLGQEKK